MKSVYVSIGLLGVILFVACFGVFQVGAYKTHLTEILEQVETLVLEEELEEAKEKISLFLSCWEGYDPVLTLFVRHTVLDEIESTSSALLALLTHGDASGLLAQIAVTKGLLHIMWDDEQVSWKNIF